MSNFNFKKLQQKYPNYSEDNLRIMVNSIKDVSNNTARELYKILNWGVRFEYTYTPAEFYQIFENISALKKHMHAQNIPSTITTLETVSIFSRNSEDAIRVYGEYKRNKTTAMRKIMEETPELADTAQIDSFIRRYGQEIGEQKYKENQHKQKLASVLQILYYTQRGISEEEAKETIQKIQSRFSLEKCVSEYGDAAGNKKWKERQEKWLHSMSSKSDSEKIEINKKKSLTLSGFIQRGKQVNQYKEYVNKHKSTKLGLFYTIDELKFYLKSRFEYFGYFRECVTPLPEYWFGYLGIVDKYNFCEEEFTEKWGQISYECLGKKTKFGCQFILKNLDGSRLLLRQFNEYYFAKKLLEHNIKFTIDKTYNNQNLRYDFFLEEKLYIEICGFPNDKNYVKKVEYKRDTFG